MLHIDDFIDDPRTDKYASWFFQLHRFPAALQFKFAEFIKNIELYCDYKGDRYRVTGCSRLGDVWLAKDFAQTNGYDLRVNIEDCNNFGPKANKES